MHNNTFASTLLASLLIASAAQAQTVYKFDFGSAEAADGYIPVCADMLYSPERGYGYEPGYTAQDVVIQKTTRKMNATALTRDFATGSTPFRFSVRLPEGNYKVTLTLGDLRGESATTVKSEVRRLHLESVTTGKGEVTTASFITNIRTPQLSKGNAIKLNNRELDYNTGLVRTLTWDDRLTLQFSDSAPALCALEIEPADEQTVTVFIIGDSTVTDQAGGGTWGQYLPRWFDGSVAVANHAESGMTIKGFRFGRRWDKVMESAKPGDYLLIQLGTNDEKSKGHDPMWDAEDRAGDWVRTHSAADKDYIWGLATMALEAKRHGMIPVIVSPMTKIDRRSASSTELMTPYGINAPKAAELAECAYIDLWGMSREIVAALGQDALKAYSDGTHTDNYGGYLFSLCIVKGLRDAGLDISSRIDAPEIDPSHPTPSPDGFTCPIEPRVRPVGPQ